MTDPAHPVVNLVDRRRYEVLDGGRVAGYVDYELRQDAVVFVRTELAAGEGAPSLGDVLARGALEDARTRGLTVVPVCPLVAGWLRRNPAFDGRVDWEAATRWTALRRG